ncbi:MAG: hypothetical protein ACR2OH_00890 [Microthrixaceae bacterium]
MKKSQPGRGLIITGAVLMAVGVLGIVLTVGILGSRLDLESFSRDVAINGELDSAVPGQIGFRIIESLSSDDDTMTVGVALNSSSTAFDCEIVDVRGESILVRRGSSNDTFVSGDVDADWTVAVVAEDLDPGEYSARCEAEGEPSAAPDAQFTVGRILTESEMFGLVGPVFGILGAIVVGGLAGLVGLVLLIVGLVRRNKADKLPPSPPGQAHTPWSQAPPSGPTAAPPSSPWEQPPAGSPPSSPPSSPWEQPPGENPPPPPQRV